MPKVLLIDARQERLEVTRKALLVSGYEVAVATSGSLALTVLERERPDLIVSQAEMPDIVGYELCSLIRSDPRTKDLPFILVAGPTGPIAGAATRAGVDLVLGGNFNPSDVVGSVQSLV